jgi:hypothetical protein
MQMEMLKVREDLFPWEKLEMAEILSLS